MSRSQILVSCIFGLVASAGSLGAQGARWTLKETLRIGGAESGPTSFVSTRSIEADSKGRILVMDRSTQDIKMFAPDGKYLRTIGRKGSGPGEMKNAEGMIIAHDGRIWVRDAANARFTVFTRKAPTRTDDAVLLVGHRTAGRPPERSHRLRLYDRAGRGREYKVPDIEACAHRHPVHAPGMRNPRISEAATWITRSEHDHVPVDSLRRSRSEYWSCGRDGVRPTHRDTRFCDWSPEQRTPSGSPECPAVQVTKAERDSIIQTFDAKGPSGLDFDRIPKTKPAVERITVDDQGRPWIRRTNAQGAITFDIYDRDGRPVASAELGVVRTPVGYPFVVREDDVQHVVRYQIGR
jgi:hypothetical protein